jgi:hypothetical protein
VARDGHAGHLNNNPTPAKRGELSARYPARGRGGSDGCGWYEVGLRCQYPRAALIFSAVSCLARTSRSVCLIEFPTAEMATKMARAMMAARMMDRVRVLSFMRAWCVRLLGRKRGLDQAATHERLRGSNAV